MSEEGMKDLTKPIVHMNGTSRAELLKQYVAAYKAVGAAEDALSGTYPNGRDYYPSGPDAISAAMKEHHNRVMRLQTVKEELADLMLHVGGV